MIYELYYGYLWVKRVIYLSLYYSIASETRGAAQRGEVSGTATGVSLDLSPTARRRGTPGGAG